MKHNFYRYRDILNNEYENPCPECLFGEDKKTVSDVLNKLKNDNPDMPSPLLRAYMYEYVLTHASIEINPYSIFAGKIRDGVTYAEYAHNDGVLEQFSYRQRIEVYDKKLPEVMSRKRLAEKLGICSVSADFWHAVPDWEQLYRFGLSGLLRRAEDTRAAKAADGTLSEAQRVFYDGVIITYRAILAYVKRLYNASLGYNLGEYSRCLLRLQTEAPHDLYEVLELTLIFMNAFELGCERARTLGRIDILYYPYYQTSLAEGYTQEDIRELFRYFFTKFHSARRFANQPLELCGVSVDGLAGENELTSLILDVWEELGNDNPKLHIHYHSGISDTIMRRLLKILRSGKSSMVFLNDETVFRGYEKIGIPRHISRSYVALGCYEPIILGIEDPMVGTAWINMAKAVEFAINGGKDIITGENFGPRTPEEFDSWESFYRAFLTQLDCLVDFVTDTVDQMLKYNTEANPSPVYSGVTQSCIERGRDIFDGGVRYSNTSFKCFSAATTVDSLLAVRRLVYEEGAVTLDELCRILQNNWEGQESLRLKVKNSPEKYGCGCAAADELARDIYAHISKRLSGRHNTAGGRWRIGADSITYNYSYGRTTSATPDGRLKGEPLSKNLSASPGMDREGVTALILSATVIDHTDLLDGAVLDFLLHPSSVQGEEGLEAMLKLVKVYFARGGMAIQGNVLDAERLIDAQKNPQAYPTLQVRVCGWNEYFNAMSKQSQDAFIEQSKAL